MKDACSTTGSALETARAFHPQVALLEFGLPGIDGYEVAGRLRAEPGVQGTLLVALTGCSDPAYRLQAAAAGFHHHLAKPLDLDTLRALLADEPAIVIREG